MGTYNGLFVEAARFFGKRGLNVVRFDFRGSGNSDGGFEDQSVSTMLEDLRALVAHAKTNLTFDGRIILVGYSLGFYVSTFFASKNPPELIGLVGWMGRVSDADEFFSKVTFEQAEFKGYLQHPHGFFIPKEKLAEELKYKSRKAIGKLKVPVLLIYGERDEVTPPPEGIKFQRYYKPSEKVEMKIFRNSTT